MIKDWFIINDGLIFDSYGSFEDAKRANVSMFWETALVVDSTTLIRDFELDPEIEKNWVEYYA